MRNDTATASNVHHRVVALLATHTDADDQPLKSHTMPPHDDPPVTPPQLDEPLDFTVVGALATVTFNRPQVRNALSAELLDRFDAALESVESNSQIRTLLLRGAGTCFSAGADLDELAAARPDDAVDSHTRFAATLRRLAALPVPVVADIHGYALGGGFIFTLYCDVRIATDDAQLGFPAASRHWLPPLGLARLAAWLGPARAQHVALAAGTFSAQQALSWGLVEQVVTAADRLTAVRDAVDRLKLTRRDVTVEIRRYFAELGPFDEAAADHAAAEAFRRCFETAETQSALAALRPKSK